ncbi:hypothetical protein UlMin_044905 [Ulmus minor]
MAAPASSSSLSCLKKYDVFLSFRGEDTRNNFTSHLYKALCDKDIETYIDEESLERGDEISPALLEAIRQSNIAIVVFSKNYASSSWCLSELVNIIQCYKKEGQIVMPIFYHVDPSDIRKQKGSFGEAFENHEERFKDRMEKVLEWRSALETAANLSGWDSKDRVEAKLIEEIVKDVLSKLNNLTSSDDLEGLIGIEKHIRKIKKLLSVQSTDVHVVGICGMGGIGKTTIAGVVFNQLFYQFSGCCFVANVREESEKLGIRSLRDKLLAELLKEENIYSGNPSLKPTFVRRLRRKRVLLVLDDVNDYEQFEYLAGDDWFGPESRVIVTTRDLQVLTNINARVKYEVKKYEVRQLDYDDALQLFSLTAFKGIDSPRSDYVEVSKDVVRFAGGIPLVIKTLGSYLRSCVLKGLPWEMTLETLKECSPENVQKKLVISYNGLNKLEKAVFLDIACFFKGMFQDAAVDILNKLYQSANWLIENLIDKSLIATRGYEKQLWMHDLLQEMGWEKVREESIKLGKRSRLWIAREVCDVLEDNKGTEAIQKIILDTCYMAEEISLSARVFQQMSNLTLLKIYSSDGHDINECKVYPLEGLWYLPCSLRYLEWSAFPANSLPLLPKPWNLVELKMPHSQLEQFWDGSKRLEKLTRIDLSYSEKLTQFPNLSGAPNLEIINLEHCTSLLQVPSNHLQNVDKLVDLNFSHCSCLSSLPDTIVARALKVLNLSGCSHLSSIPEILGTSMERLYLDSTSIKELPSSIGAHKHLSLLSLENCKCLESLPSSIQELEFIESLSLGGCSVLEKIPNLPKNMKELGLRGSAIKEIPSSIESLFGLESITLSSCQRLESLPTSIFKLRHLTELILSNCSNLRNFPEILEPVESLRVLRLDRTGIKQLPSSIHNLNRLRHLDLAWCESLECLPNKLCIMHSLQILELSNCSKLYRLSSLAGLTSLESLNLSGTSISRIPPSIKRLSKLQILRVKYCKNLQSLTELPLVLEYLDASECPSLETLSNSEKVLSRGAGCEDYHIEEKSVVSFLFFGCLKLDSNNIMINFRFRVLRKALRYEPGDYLVFVSFFVNCCYPGSEVPNWFEYQFEGPSIKIKLPPQWNNTNFLGFVVCAVAAGDYDPHPVTLRLSCKFRLWKTNRGETDPFRWRFDDASIKYGVPTLNSPHIFMWFQYQMYGQDAEEASFDFFFEEWINQTYVKSTKTKVTRCGIRMLYRVDGEEFGFTPYPLYLIDGPTDAIYKPESSGRRTMTFDLHQHMIRYS